MEVKQLESLQKPQVEFQQVTQEELQKEFDYYMAQRTIETMFLYGMISLAEFNKISALNREKFSPFLAEIIA